MAYSEINISASASFAFTMCDYTKTVVQLDFEKITDDILSSLKLGLLLSNILSNINC